MAVFGLVCLFGTGAWAQLEAPLGATFVGTWDGWRGSEYADVWGDGNDAFVAHFGDEGVHILDISDAANPIQKTLITMPLMADPHNLFCDPGFPYIVNSGTPDFDTVDLRAYDPDNAPASISTLLWKVSSVGAFVHDVTVYGGRLYTCAWSGLWVYDLTNVETEAPTFLATVSGSSTHSAWPTADLKYAVTWHELSGGGIKVFETVDNGGSLTLELRGSFALPGDPRRAPGRAASAPGRAASWPTINGLREDPKRLCRGRGFHFGTKRASQETFDWNSLCALDFGAKRVFEKLLSELRPQRSGPSSSVKTAPSRLRLGWFNPS